MADLKHFIREERGISVVRLPAELTASEAYDFEGPLMQLMRKDAPLVLLDMSEVSQITSAAISLLIKLTKTAERQNGMVAIAAPSPVVEDVFAITKMEGVLHIFGGRDEAMKALLPGGVCERSAGAESNEAAVKDIVLFKKPGPQNTERTLRAARERAEDLGIKHVVVATSTGATAVKAVEAFMGMNVRIIAITLMAGVWAKYSPPDPELVKKAKDAGVKFLTATHPLMGNVGTAIREKFGGVPEVELIAHTYYTFSQGMKVAVEIALMAADAAFISTDEDVIAIAGTGSGADTAIVIRPAYSPMFFDTKIREVIAMPR